MLKARKVFWNARFTQVRSLYTRGTDVERATYNAERAKQYEWLNYIDNYLLSTE